jgi:hypothetical protein
MLTAFRLSPSMVIFAAHEIEKETHKLLFNIGAGASADTDQAGYTIFLY